MSTLWFPSVIPNRILSAIRRVATGFERVIAVDELTILCAYRVWRSTLILSIASCYLMWGKSGSLALCYPLFLFPRTQAMPSMLSSTRSQIPYLHHRPSHNHLRPFFSPTNSQHKLAYPESSTNSVLFSNHLPLAMAPSHSPENERFPKLGR